jgi:hypothetical protein
MSFDRGFAETKDAPNYRVGDDWAVVNAKHLAGVPALLAEIRGIEEPRTLPEAGDNLLVGSSYRLVPVKDTGRRKTRVSGQNNPINDCNDSLNLFLMTGAIIKCVVY